MARRMEIVVTEAEDGTLTATRDRREPLGSSPYLDVLLARLSGLLRPGERVYVEERSDGYRREVTRDLARLRPRRDDAVRRLR